MKTNIFVRVGAETKAYEDLTPEEMAEMFNRMSKLNAERWAVYLLQLIHNVLIKGLGSIEKEDTVELILMLSKYVKLLNLNIDDVAPTDYEIIN